MTPEQLQAAVLRNIEAHCLVIRGQTALVGLSGGLDSVALLHILLGLREGLGIQIQVASLDHGIRGEASREDLNFVRCLCERWGLPLTAGRVDAPRLAGEAGMGMEEAARRARYDFFAEAATDCGASCVAVGHHALDQAETVLMHVLRGAGLNGLCGMRFATPMPYHEELTLIRPMLNISRRQLEAYCEARQLPFRHDSSNDDTRYTRNFIRHRVVKPLLMRQPQLLTAVNRLADSVSVDGDFLELAFQRDVMPLVDVSDSRWSVAISDYAPMHMSMKRRLFRAAFQQLNRGGWSLSHKATVDLIDWLKDAGVGKVCDMGAGIQLRVGYESVYVERRDSPPTFAAYKLIPPETCVNLCAPTRFKLGHLSCTVTFESVAVSKQQALRLPADGTLRLRTRRQGERFRPRGMGGRSRKLKDWMIDRKIPAQIRGQIPLLCHDGAVIAVCVGETWHLADMSHLHGHRGPYVTVILD